MVKVVRLPPKQDTALIVETAQWPTSACIELALNTISHADVNAASLNTASC